MANEAELTERLYRRFKGVPNFENTNAQELVEESLQAHGFAPSADVPSDEVKKILLYAQIQASWQIAFSVAHYFKFTDGEESVDKSMVSENYRKLAKDLQADYDSDDTSNKPSSNFAVMKRLDRP